MSRRAWLAVLLTLAAGAAGYHLISDGRAGPGPDSERPALQPWDLLGCWEVRLTSWTATPGSDTSAGAPGDAPGADPRRAVDAGSLPDALEPPRRVMLMADSVDLWGRVLDSYRAVALDPDAPTRAPVGETARRARSLRWLTAHDTLWILWSQDGTRAGVALTRRDDRFRGVARALVDSTDVSAGAEARPRNCATGDIDSAAPWRRR